MSNTLAQNPSAATYSSATSVTVLFGSAMTNPSLVVAMLTIEQPTATATISDNKNAGNYTQDVTATQNAGGGGDGKSIIASKQNTQTAAATVTASLSTNCDGVLKVQEYTGAATSSALDTSNSGNGTNSQPSVTITTGSANDTVVAVSTHYGGGAAADTNYTASYTETGIANAYHFGEHRVDAGAAGSITLQMGLPSSESGWGMAVAAYKTSGGGSGNTIAVPAGNLVLSGKIPTVNVSANQTIAVPAGSLALNAFAPTVLTPNVVAVPAGALTLNAFAPTVINGVTIQVPLGVLTLTAQAPTVLATQNITVSIPSATLTLTGFAPIILGAQVIADQPSGGGYWYGEYERYSFLRRKRKRELEEIEEEQQRIEDEANREIARLLQIQERKDAERKDLQRLKELVARFRDISPVDVDSDRVRNAIVEAQRKASTANLERLQREFERMLEEEEHAVLLLLASLD